MAKHAPQTIDADDEDTDICPVCDVQCTCPKQTSLPSLKIKLTVPPNLFLVPSSNKPAQTTSGSASSGYPSRKRGRPPKSSSKTKPVVRTLLPKRAPTSTRRKKKLAAALAHPRKDPHHEENTSSSSQTDVDMPHYYPTFLDASAIESLASSSDSNNDSIRPTRTTRQPANSKWIIHPRKTSVNLTEAELGTEMNLDSDSEDDDDDDDQDSDDDPAADTTTTTPLIPFFEPHDSESITTPPPPHPLHKQSHHRPRIIRLGNAGWSLDSSEDDESSFDADIFFRYLYDSSSSSSSCSADDDDDDALTEGPDGERDVLNKPFFSPPRVESLPFELAESWDGGVVFTNGEAAFGDAYVETEKPGFGFRVRDVNDVEMGMNLNGCASCIEDGYLEEDVECEGDEHGFSFNEAGDDDDHDHLERVSTDSEELVVGSGNTTDDDLVGSDFLPNERAMKLFKLPLPVWGSVSAVDPLSLVSSSSRPRRELEMMEEVEGIGDKRRRGKGKNRGKGRMRREAREKGSKEKRKEGKKKRDVPPSPLDILKGRGTYWDKKMDEDLSSSSGSVPGYRSPRTSTPTPAYSPTTPVPATPALSITTSFTTAPRKGVFVVPPSVSEWTKTGKRKGKARETAVVVIGEDRKDVPSPHPRKRTRPSLGGDTDILQVEHLLKKHLVDTLDTSSLVNLRSEATIKTTPPPTPLLGLPFSPIEDCIFSSPLVRGIQLADVLDAEFLKDDDTVGGSPSEGENDKEKVEAFEGNGKTVLSIETGTSASSFLPPPLNSPPPPSTPISSSLSDADLAADAAAVKNLSRWNLISVGAFRQTQQATTSVVGENGHGPLTMPSSHVGRTPGSSADYGNAMKKSGKFALGVLWRGDGASPVGGKDVKNSSPGGGGGMRRIASGGMIGSKHAKKRRLTMNSSSTSVMKDPLILPATSVGASTSGSVVVNSTPTTTTTPTSGNGGDTIVNPTVVPSKTRQEARRERKHQKRSASHDQPYGPRTTQPHFHSHHHQQQHQHQYHTHYHHPNAKTRGMGSVQRLGGWYVGEGSSSGGGAGGGGGGGGGGAGFGGLGF